MCRARSEGTFPDGAFVKVKQEDRAIWIYLIGAIRVGKTATGPDIYYKNVWEYSFFYIFVRLDKSLRGANL